MSEDMSLAKAKTGNDVAPNICNHKRLKATFLGAQDSRFGAPTFHFRGIPYGHVAARFAKATPVARRHHENINTTKFGPICPQPQVDVGHLLRLPANTHGVPAVFDEFECLNLNVHRPLVDTASEPLPVIVWIHGGSQVVTFAPASDPVCDPTRLVAQSARLGKPVIFVSINYRLNIFAFGDGVGERNLALHDQRLAIEWVVENIQDFGGDPNNITLAGESAGAVYVHAHILSSSPVQRAVIASGSALLSPPLPVEVGNSMITRIAKVVQELEPTKSLRTASALCLVSALTACQINSMWLQQDDSLEGWKDRVEDVSALMVGDVEFESVIWRNGIEQMTPSQIVTSFSAAGQDYAQTLMDLYRIDLERSTQSKLGALDFLNDARFALPSRSIAERLGKIGMPVYQYIIDQANPWQSSSRAHHGIDLILLFGGIDSSANVGAEAVGERLRESWITFAHGAEPWRTGCCYAFGPLGRCDELKEEDYAQRRRVKCLEYLSVMPLERVNTVFAALAAGRISLLN